MCICLWLQHKNELVFPYYISNHLQNYTTTIRRATSLTLHFLSTICVVCDHCNEHDVIEIHCYIVFLCRKHRCMYMNKEGGRKREREGSREGGREEEREEGRERGREAGKEGGRKRGRERGREAGMARLYRRISKRLAVETTSLYCSCFITPSHHSCSSLLKSTHAISIDLR